MSFIGYCFAVARALREVFSEISLDLAKWLYRDAFYASREPVDGALWRIFRSDEWMKDSMRVGCVIALIFICFRLVFRMEIGTEIGLAFVYAFIAYVPNAGRFLDEGGSFDISFLMTLYYTVFMFGMLWGAYQIAGGLLFIVATVGFLLVVIDLYAGFVEKHERALRWQLEAEKEAYAAPKKTSNAR